MKVGLELGGSGYGKVSLYTEEMRNGEHILILDIDEYSSILGEALPRTRSDEMICGDVYLDMDEVQQLRTYLNVLHNSGLLRERL